MPIGACRSVICGNQGKVFESIGGIADRDPRRAEADIATRSTEGLDKSLPGIAQLVNQAVPGEASAGSMETPRWPPPFLTHAKLEKTKGWHLLNELTYGAWGSTTAGRAILQVTAFATGKIDTLSITSHAPATNEAGLVGGVFAVLEAAGTVHVAWKAGRKKSELEECSRKCASGRERFVHGDEECKERIAWLFGRQRELEALLQNWPVDDQENLLPEIAHETDPNQPPRKLADTKGELEATVKQLKERALELVKDLEDYIQYEQAASELADATDNIHALGLATARDVVIQLGGTACSVAATLGKAGVPGVDLAAAGVAGGAFSVAMGTMHVAASALAWYQSTRRLEDVEAARSRGSDWQNPHTRQQRVSDIANALPQERPHDAASAKASEPVVALQHEPAQDVEQGGSARLSDIQRANDMIEVMMHHREKAFGAIEVAERLKIWWAKFRMAYGGVSIGIGTGLIVAGVVFGLVPPVGILVGAVALLSGTVWLVASVIRNYKNRHNTDVLADNDMQALARAKHVLGAQRDATIEEMRDNKFLAIDALLKALLDRDRPVTRDTLWKAMADFGMDRALLQALELRSLVRLDEVYAGDRKTMIDSLRCCASSADEMALRKLIEGMTLRSDEAMLKPLRQLFQDFVEGKTSMRLEYERRVGFFPYMAGKLPPSVRRWLGLSRHADVEARTTIPAQAPVPPQGTVPAQATQPPVRLG